MAYTQHTWESGELVTAAKLNNLEAGVAAAETQEDLHDLIWHGETSGSEYTGIMYSKDNIRAMLQIGADGEAAISTSSDSGSTWSGKNIIDSTDLIFTNIKNMQVKWVANTQYFQLIFKHTDTYYVMLSFSPDGMVYSYSNDGASTWNTIWSK